jgi:hypothetical protein
MLTLGVVTLASSSIELFTVGFTFGLGTVISICGTR